jgi:hypothetical protein
LLKITCKKKGKQQETKTDYCKEAFSKEKFLNAAEDMA